MAKRKKLRKKTKRQLGKNKIYALDWLRKKPYDNGSPYDNYYVQVANEVWELLKEEHKFFQKYDFGKEQYVELSMFLTSHFEDFISDIGLWNVFIQKNKNLYGYYLPFYDLDSYEADYLNPEDYCFLLWYFMEQRTEFTFAPDAPIFFSLGYALYEFFEASIDDAPATDFYTSYFNLENDSFFDIKSKLHWLSMESYLLGFELSKKYKENVEDMMKPDEKTGEVNPFFMERFEEMAYGMADDILYGNRISLSAIAPTECLAAIGKCSESKKQQILALPNRVMSRFIFDEADDTHYMVRELLSNNVFNVNKESATIRPKPVKGDIFITTIYPWDSEWWISGTLVNTQKIIPQEELEKDKKKFQETPYHAYTESQKKELTNNTEEGHNLFLEFFGTPVVLLEDMKVAQEKMQQFLDFQTQKKNIKVDEKMKKNRERFNNQWNKMMPDAKNTVAITSIEGVGTAFSSALPKVINLLQSIKPLSKDEQVELFYYLVEEEPFVLRYLLEKYPTYHIQYPVSLSEIDAVEHIEFLARYYNPNAFGLVKPTMRILPESEEFIRF